LDYDAKKYPLVNHFESDYIVFSRIKKYSEDSRLSFRSEPKNYLIHDRGHEMFHIHLFEAMNGITNDGELRRYLILYAQKLKKIRNKMFHETYNPDEAHQEIPSDKRIRSLDSMYVPPFMDVILTDNDTNETISLRENYPIQMFISYIPYSPGNSNKFFNFYNERNNVTINSRSLTSPTSIKSAVGSVFLRYKYSPFSVFEFQQNEVVYWHDLMKYPGDNKFVTNNGVASH
jgi:hypothetical protein